MGLVASGPAILLIARGLQTARASHRILVVDDGLIVEGGSHEDQTLEGRDDPVVVVHGAPHRMSLPDQAWILC